MDAKAKPWHDGALLPAMSLCWAKFDRIRRADRRQDRQQILLAKHDATFGRAPILAREMDEDRAAGARHGRIVIVADDENQIVEMILAP